MSLVYTVDRTKENEREQRASSAMALMMRFVLSTLLSKLLDSYKDFEERKMAQDFTRQASALITVCRALLKQIPNSNEKLHTTCTKLVRSLLQKHEIGITFIVWN